LDGEILAQLRPQGTDNDNTDVPALEDESGSCATVAIITYDQERHKWLVSVVHLGDSRLYLVRDGKTQQITIDHRPSNTEERARIEKAGGFVYQHRVSGRLAVSRAFGDCSYKAAKDLKAMEQKVISQPSVYHLECDPDDWILILCDGFFERWPTHEQVVKEIKKACKLAGNDNDPAELSRQLGLASIEAGSSDNHSGLFLHFTPTAASTCQAGFSMGQHWHGGFTHDRWRDALATFIPANHNDRAAILDRVDGKVTTTTIKTEVLPPAVKTEEIKLKKEPAQSTALVRVRQTISQSTSPPHPTTRASYRDFSTVRHHRALTVDGAKVWRNAGSTAPWATAVWRPRRRATRKRIYLFAVRFNRALEDGVESNCVLGVQKCAAPLNCCPGISPASIGFHLNSGVVFENDTPIGDVDLGDEPVCNNKLFLILDMAGSRVTVTANPLASRKTWISLRDSWQHNDRWRFCVSLASGADFTVKLCRYVTHTTWTPVQEDLKRWLKK
jgi:serine/threonine protein phosphatase PrpC